MKINKVDDTTVGIVYFITDLDYIKIGFTSEPIDRRLERLQTGNARKLYVLGYIKSTIILEKNLHEIFETLRIRPNSEWFYAEQVLLDFINDNNEDNKYVCYSTEESKYRLTFYQCMSST